jgi:competence ComEA-like helix-hairpin-helix protein
MIATRALHLGTLLTLTLALAASLGTSNIAYAQTAKAKEKAKAVEAAKGSIDLNSATAEELQTLPGIGEATARKIIDSRPHKTVADLAAHGVPASTIEKIKPLVEVKPLPTPVDVNTAPIERLETLPGIGPALAKEIVAARPHAGYESIAKLKGIGPEKLDALKGRLEFAKGASVAKAKAKVEEAKVEEAKAKTKVAEAKEGMPKAKAKVEEVKAKAKVAEAKVEEKAKAKVEEVKTKVAEAKDKEAAKPKLAPGTKVNINTASKDVLDALPGIGPVKAQAILDYRAEKKFERIEDIMQVKGIKEVEFGKIKDMINVK